MKVFNVEFAPFDVPLERRIQTLCTSIIIAVSLLGSIGCCVIFIFILLFGPKWMQILMIFYSLLIYFESDVCVRSRCKWISEYYRRFRIFHHFINYFPVKLIKTVDLDSSKNYIFCTFPHGILPFGAGSVFGTNLANCEELFPGLEFTMLVLNLHFYIPFFREYVIATGSLGASAKTMDYLLTTKPTKGYLEKFPKQSRAIILYVGGASEGCKTKPDTYNIIVRRRKGFVKKALQYGTSLVPVFSFGENDYYNQIIFPEGTLIKRFQNFVQNITGFAPLIINGRGMFQYTFGLLPRRAPINVVVGAPLEIPKMKNPTDEEVNKYHTKFIEKLIELFETHKSKYVKNHENVSLILDD